MHTKKIQAFFKMAEAARNRLPSGYDEEFVSEVEDDLHCIICQLPLMKPVLTSRV